MSAQGQGLLLEKYWPKANSGAQLADLLRIDLVYKFGGVYVDSDLRLFKPLDDLVEAFEFFIASENGTQLTNAIFGACKNSPVLRQLIDELIDAEPDWTLPPNITTGPYFFAENLKWRKDITVLPRETFYPYGPFFNGEKIHSSSVTRGASLGKLLEQYCGSCFVINHISFAQTSLAWQYSVCERKPQAFCSFCFNIWHRIQSHDPLRPLPGPLPRSYQCSDELVVHTIHGHRIVVDGRDLSLTPEVVFNGYYELPEQLFLKHAVTGGDWVIDVGANIGTFSLLAAQLVGSFGRVFAFEPNPRPLALLSKSSVLNWMHERIIRRPVAVGKSKGNAKLTFNADRLGDGQIGQEDVNASSNAETINTLGAERATVLNVPCISLDEEFSVDVPIKVLKIDAEGYEGHVLAGADRLLRKRCVDFVLIELLKEISGSRWHETIRQVNTVIGYGYAVCILTEEGTTIEQTSLVAALKNGYRNIVLAAREQHKFV